MGAVCGKAARTDLCGGREVTRVPTATGIFALTRALGAKQALRDIGMPESGIDRAADLASQNPYPNPRPIEREAMRALIARACAGVRRSGPDWELTHEGDRGKMIRSMPPLELLSAA